MFRQCHIHFFPLQICLGLKRGRPNVPSQDVMAQVMLLDCIHTIVVFLDVHIKLECHWRVSFISSEQKCRLWQNFMSWIQWSISRKYWRFQVFPIAPLSALSGSWNFYSSVAGPKWSNKNVVQEEAIFHTFVPQQVVHGVIPVFLSFSFLLLLTSAQLFSWRREECKVSTFPHSPL